MTTAISSATAIDVAKFVQSIGVNTHLGNWTVYENVGLVESSLAYLGVTTVRDGSMFSTAHAQAAYSQLATDGIKFDFFTPAGTDPSTFIKQLDAFVAAHPGSLFAIEGPNEVDLQAFSYNGSSSLSSAAAFQRALFAAVEADPNLKDAPVYNLTLSQPNTSNYNQVGSLASAADDANIHAYVWSGTTPNQVLVNDMNIARWDSAGLPVVFTETGYDTMTSDPMSGVDQMVQAKYTLDTLMDAFKNGVAQTFLYELFDEASDPNFTNSEAHFGLFNNDGSPKLVATAIHNLTTILSDPNALQPFTSGSLGYGLDNMPSTASQLLLEKHDGTFDLVLWDEHVIWDPTQQKEIASPISDVTLNLGKSYAVVYVFDPLVGTGPIATYTNVSQIHVALTDHPLVIQIGSGNVTSSASSSTGALTDTTPPDAPSIASSLPGTGLVGDGITNANLLTLTGTAEADSTVNVFDGTTQIGTATANAAGAWSFATGTLADGSHTFTSVAVDATGGASAASAAWDVTVDTQPRVAPELISGTPASANTMIVSGTAEAGTTVKLYEGAALLGTTLATSSGTWSMDIGSLAAGPHQLSATATDAAGNLSQLSNVLNAVEGTLVEAAGTTSLTKVGSNFYMSDADAAVTLKFNGEAYVAGQFSNWTPIAAEATSSGYDVAWKNTSTGLYTVWTADSNGNFTSNLLSNVSGTSAAFESIETLFQQDLNGDGVVGLRTTIIEAAGATSLVQAGSNYLLSPTSGGTGPTLKFNGEAYVAGQFSGWLPIGAEATSSGYDVAWKNTSTGVYTVWTADSNGNFTSNLLSNVSGTSAAFESIETLFQQDLNGDGVVGLRTTIIEAAGATSLVQAGSNYLLSPTSGGTGPTLKFNGEAYVAGQFSGWLPIGAEATSSGYDVAWKNTSTGLYTVWTADSNGNFTSNLLSNVSGTSAAFESIETLFQQDLNGDGVVGLRTTIIEAAGATSLVQAGSNYLLSPTSGGTGPTLKFNGEAYVAGHFSGWLPIGAEATSSGYDVAWKNTSTGLYTVWTADSNGNFTSNLLSNVSGTSAALKSIEAVLHQDLNGDGVIDTASTALNISGKAVLALSNMSQAATIEAGATLELTGATSGAITFASKTGTLVLDHASQFSGTISGLSGNGNAASSNVLDLKDTSFAAGTTASYSGNTAGGVLTVSDAQHHVSHITLVGDYTHSTFNLSSDGSGGTLVIDPPADSFVFAAATPQAGGPSMAAPTLAGDLVSHSSAPAEALYEFHLGPGQGPENEHFAASHLSPIEGFLLHV